MDQPTGDRPPGWGEPGYRPPTTPPPFGPPPKRSHRLWILGVAGAAALLLVVAVVVALATAFGGGSDKQAAPATTATAGTTEATDEPAVTEETTGEPLALAVGEPGSFTGGDAGADIVVTKIQAATSDLEQFGQSVPKRGWYVIFHVKATGTSGAYDVNPLDFYVKSAGGFHNEDPEYLESWGQPLESGTLHAGEHLSGTLVYDVPARHGQLVYAPNYGGAPLATWSF